MILTGGLRRRLIKDNLYFVIHSALDDLGWFDGTFATMPVELIPQQLDSQTEILPNKVALSTEDLDSEGMEMGSDLDKYTWEAYLDIFAEDESVGIHLSGDLYDILKGKMSSIGRGKPSFPVKDLSSEVEEELFVCDIESVHLARVKEFNRQHERFWWVVGCELVDTYYGE